MSKTNPKSSNKTPSSLLESSEKSEPVPDVGMEHSSSDIKGPQSSQNASKPQTVTTLNTPVDQRHEVDDAIVSDDHEQEGKEDANSDEAPATPFRTGKSGDRSALSSKSMSHSWRFSEPEGIQELAFSAIFGSALDLIIALLENNERGGNVLGDLSIDARHSLLQSISLFCVLSMFESTTSDSERMVIPSPSLSVASLTPKTPRRTSSSRKSVRAPRSLAEVIEKKSDNNASAASSISKLTRSEDVTTRDFFFLIQHLVHFSRLIMLPTTDVSECSREIYNCIFSIVRTLLFNRDFAQMIGVGDLSVQALCQAQPCFFQDLVKENEGPTDEEAQVVELDQSSSFMAEGGGGQHIQPFLPRGTRGFGIGMPRFPQSSKDPFAELAEDEALESRLMNLVLLGTLRPLDYIFAGDHEPGVFSVHAKALLTCWWYRHEHFFSRPLAPSSVATAPFGIAAKCTTDLDEAGRSFRSSSHAKSIAKAIRTLNNVLWFRKNYSAQVFPPPRRSRIIREILPFNDEAVTAINNIYSRQMAARKDGRFHFAVLASVIKSIPFF